jgi:hypothetical protein
MISTGVGTVNRFVTALHRGGAPRFLSWHPQNLRTILHLSLRNVLFQRRIAWEMIIISSAEVDLPLQHCEH